MKRYISILLLLVVLVSGNKGITALAQQATEQESTQATEDNNGTYIKYEVEKQGIIIDEEGKVNIRSTPTTSTNTNLLGIQLDYRDRVTVIGEDKEVVSDTKEYVWYHIKFNKSGTSYEGYVRGDLIQVYEPATEADEEAIRKEIKALGFPESYVEPLVKLKLMNPSWSFVPYFTNYEWEDMVKAETEGVYNLVQNSYPSSWKSLDYGYFDWQNNLWIIVEGDDRVKASREIVEYYLDPRNFFDEKQIFQFELLGYDENIHNESGVESVISGSFMDSTVLADDSEQRTFAQAFMQIGKELEMSPYYLAGKVLMEQGRKGTSSLISGKYPGYEGYYNFFNIGATGVSETNIIINGLKYAKNRGWNTRFKALYGGASGTISSYIKRGQNTLYLQKFDVVDLIAGGYLRQYAQYIWAASSEAKTTADAYYDMNLQSGALTFRIPIYNNMPETPCPKPVKDGNPNYKLGNIEVEGYSLSPAFDTDTLNYSLIVEGDVSSINISAYSYAPTTKISGLGKVSLNVGNNKIEIVSTAENGDARTYTINVTRKDYAPNKLSALSVEGHKLEPAFNSDIFEYTVTVPYTTNEVNIGASTYMANSVITGTGKKTVSVGENVFEIVVTGADQSTNKYVVKVVKNNDVVTDMSAFSVDKSTGYIHGFTVGSSVADVIAKLKVENGSVKVLDSKGNEATGLIATDQKIVVYDGAGAVKKEYPVVVYGDLNGDGKITLIDYATLKKNLWGEYPLEGAKKEATNVNHDDKVSLLDRAYLKKAIWQVIEITQ